jgi:excisionase family DNA binding protein
VSVRELERMWLDEREAAAYCGLSAKTLYRARLAGELRASGGGSGGSKILYRREWLDAWLEQRGRNG